MNNMINREYNGQTFTFREDGYFNMTKAAKAFGKDVRKFWITNETVEYMDALSANVPETAHLVETKRGNGGGTWGHPKLAVFFARWLDPKFAVFCDMVIDDILNKKAELTVIKPEEAMTFKVPQTFPEALRLAAELAEQNDKLAAENKAMSDELNYLTVDEYRALTHRYFSHSFKVRLGQKASQLLRSEGKSPERQTRTVSTFKGDREVTINLYPREVLQRAEELLAA